MSKAFFITGTDTDAGKTVIAAALLRKAQELGLTTLGLKPVAAGGYLEDEKFVNDDAWWLQRLSSTAPDYADVNPVALKQAIAPHIAAEQEGVRLDATGLADHCRRQAATAEFCVIEGAGGWLVPLNADQTMANLAGAIGAPVILVTGLRLGCINHTLLTVAAIEASGLELAGWVANQIDPDMPACAENIATLAARITAPLLGTVPFLRDLDLDRVADNLAIERLL
jgi:dethiobiotin synthetase